MRKSLHVAPHSWLSLPPNPVRNLSDILGAFSHLPIVYEYSGPHSFCRAAGRDAKGGLASPYGGWWVDETELVKLYARLEQFEGWLPDSTLNAAIPAQYRAMTALCYDWNDMSEFFVLKLPQGQTLVAIAGATKEQPAQSSMNAASASTPMLRGGAEQVFMKVKNPLLVTSYDL